MSFFVDSIAFRVAFLGSLGLLVLLLPYRPNVTALRNNGRVVFFLSVFCFVSGMIIAAVAVRCSMDNLQLVPDTKLERLKNSLRATLNAQMASGWRPRNVVLINGGSATYRGIDPVLLKDMLEKAGYDSLVLQVALDGMPHFERLELLNGLFDRLAEPAYEKTQKIYLREFHRPYDLNPMENVLYANSRSIEFLSPEIAFNIMRSLYVSHESLSAKLASIKVLVEATLKWSFNVGRWQRIHRVSHLGPDNGYKPLLGNKLQLSFDKLKASVDHLRKLSSGRQPIENIELSPWLNTIYTPLLHADDARWQTIGIMLPNQYDSYAEYYYAYCANHNMQCLNGPSYLALLDQLSHPEYWYDNGHLSRRGSVILTKWLAEELVGGEILER